MNRICIQWPRFGPYHLARLRAAHAHVAERGVEVVGFETAGDDALYEWRVERDREPFRREQVFPGRVFEDIPPAEMHAGVVAALDRLDPDAVGIMSYGYPDARAALAWCRRHRRVAVIMMETKADDAERVGWRERVKALIVAQFDAALVGGTPQRAYMEQLGFPPDLIFTTYNAVDNAYFREGAAAARATPDAFQHLPGLGSDEPFFLASNRFLPRKNLDRLLRGYGRYRAMAEAAGERPWRLLMLGDGRLRPELERIVRDEAIEGVEFCGFQQIDVLPAYYASAGAFVHSALVDQWGLVVNEAMAAGLPVVVSTGTGCSYDLVRDGENGYRFDPEDVEGLAGCLARVAAPDADRAAMGRRSAEIVEGWAPAAFGRGLWEAVQAGQARADRPANPLAQALLTGINRASRDITAFHSVEV
ncbi:MAG: glycosyltransferase family 4 protein [Rubricoccaceae bacterium]|nr:glycosyltransferase family 4 protein [Rubricoccaceae bacterium]